MRAWLLLLVLVAAGSAQKLDEVCGACHTGPAEDFRSHAHFAKGLSCDACHGPSKAHRDATGHKPVDRVAGPSEQHQVCGACHAAQGKAYAVSPHGKLVIARDARRAAACTTCHGTHSLRSAAAMGRQCARCHESLPAACSEKPKVAAKLACAGCHDPHALVGQACGLPRPHRPLELRPMGPLQAMGPPHYLLALSDLPR